MVDKVTLTSLAQLSRIHDAARNGEWSCEDFIGEVVLSHRDIPIAVATFDPLHPWWPAHAMEYEGERTPEEMEAVKLWFEAAADSTLCPRRPAHLDYNGFVVKPHVSPDLPTPLEFKMPEMSRGANSILDDVVIETGLTGEEIMEVLSICVRGCRLNGTISLTDIRSAMCGEEP